LHKLFFILFLCNLLIAPGKCLIDAKQEMDESQENLPVIVNRGYKIINGKTAQILLRKEDSAQLYSNGINSLSKEPISGLMAKEKGAHNSQEEVKLAIPVEEKVLISFEKISSLVNTIKSKLCSVNKEGSYEVWLQVEGGASGIFVSASAQTGIKAIIDCGAKHKAGL
jgi:hypothetical protein